MRKTFLILIATQTVAAVVAAEPEQPPWRVLPIYGGGYVQNVVMCPSDTNRLYTYVDVGGPYRSDDAGRNWRPLHANMPLALRNRQMDHVRTLSVDPRDADNLVIAAGNTAVLPGGIGVSRDGGRTWKRTLEANFYGNGPMRMHGFVLDRNPFCPDELVAGEDLSGIFVSRDNGETWTDFAEGLPPPPREKTKNSGLFSLTQAVAMSTDLMRRNFSLWCRRFSLRQTAIVSFFFSTFPCCACRIGGEALILRTKTCESPTPSSIRMPIVGGTSSKDGAQGQRLTSGSLETVRSFVGRLRMSGRGLSVHSSAMSMLRISCAMVMCRW